MRRILHGIRGYYGDRYNNMSNVIRAHMCCGYPPETHATWCINYHKELPTPAELGRSLRQEIREEFAEFKRLYGINNAMPATNTESIAAFRYRLREASRLALEMGDKLLALSQDANEPNTYQLKELRDIENGLDVHSRITLRNLEDAAKSRL